MKLLLSNDYVHEAEHALYLSTALLVWVPLLGVDPFPHRAGPRGQFVCMVACMVPMLVIALWLGTEGHAVYGRYLWLARTRLGGARPARGGDDHVGGGAAGVPRCPALTAVQPASATVSAAASARAIAGRSSVTRPIRAGLASGVAEGFLRHGALGAQCARSSGLIATHLTPWCFSDDVVVQLPEFHRWLIPRTAVPSMFACLSKDHGIATAFATSCLSIVGPQVWARALAPVGALARLHHRVERRQPAASCTCRRSPSASRPSSPSPSCRCSPGTML